MQVRRALHGLGLRYFVHSRPIAEFRREADVAFSRVRVAVFVDGCFWHGCRRHRSPSGRNREWWEQKLRRNVLRDRETNRRLVGAGWFVIRVWEHADPVAAARAIARVVRRRASGAVAARLYVVG
jgi:DNA mismatch endonuclease (patch repair protein)